MWVRHTAPFYSVSKEFDSKCSADLRILIRWRRRWKQDTILTRPYGKVAFNQNGLDNGTIDKHTTTHHLVSITRNVLFNYSI